MSLLAVRDSLPQNDRVSPYSEFSCEIRSRKKPCLTSIAKVRFAPNQPFMPHSNRSVTQ